MLIRFLISLLLFALVIPSYANEIDEGREAIDYLKALDIEDLLDVEVVLDDVFDVFDGLIKARKTTIATGESQSMARAPSVTSVITAQDIEAMGATNANDALRAVPGLFVTGRSVDYMPQFFIRGMSSTMNPEILMLVNGIPWQDLFYGGRNQWEGVPANAISRIEVIRGPGSAVYGADAFGGVINIITKRKDDIDGTETGVRLGNFSTKDAWISHGEQWGGFDVAFMFDYHSAVRIDEFIESDAQTEYDKLFGTSVSLAPGPISGSRRTFDIHLDVSRGNWHGRAAYQGWDYLDANISGTQTITDDFEYRLERFSTDLTYHNPTLTKYWDVTAQLSVIDLEAAFTTDWLLYPRGAFGGAYPNGMIGNPGSGQRHTRLDLFGFYAGFKKHLIRIGTGYHYGDLYQITESKNFGIDPTTGMPFPPGSPPKDISDTAETYQPEGSRKDWYISLQDIWTLTSDWELTLGIRYDHYSDFGTTINPRLALVWQPRLDFTTKLLYGSAFRAPSFQELYSTSNPILLGNPGLDAETIKTWELAFDYRAADNLHLAINLFNYQASDKILYIPKPGAATGTAQFAQNAGSQKAYGSEIEARWKMTAKSSLLANYAFVTVTDKRNDHDTGNYPRHSAYLRTDWLLYPNWYLDAQVNWIGEIKRVYGDPRPPVDDSATVDLTLRRKDIKEGHWNMAASVRNLFDTDAHIPSSGPDSNGIIAVPNDFPVTGRHYFLELRYRF